ncbi:hypothetical protein CPC08DRAFT_712975 [Agrocybe pediades]|nr:hypothetical protein CPC08DRAFT_712975 [Agrocybe pediades]
MQQQQKEVECGRGSAPSPHLHAPVPRYPSTAKLLEKLNEDFKERGMEPRFNSFFQTPSPSGESCSSPSSLSGSSMLLTPASSVSPSSSCSSWQEESLQQGEQLEQAKYSAYHLEGNPKPRGVMADLVSNPAHSCNACSYSSLCHALGNFKYGQDTAHSCRQCGTSSLCHALGNFRYGRD